MTRFNYTLEETEVNGLEEVIKEVRKSVKETYPDLDILKRGLKNKRQTATIRKGLLKAMQGQAEAPIVQIEEEWFKEQETIQNLQKELRTLIDVQAEEYKAIQEAEKEDSGVSDAELADLKYALAQTEKRMKKINGYTQMELIFNPRTGQEEQKEVTYKGLIEEAEERRNEKEEANEFLKAYRGEETTAVRPEPAADVKITDEDVKKLIAHERDLKVRNSEDTLADLAKMNSLLFSTVGAIYGTLSDTAKGKIPDETRAVIEYSIQEFNKVQTRADRQLTEDGTALVDKLFQREVQIADIIDEVKSTTK